MTPQTTQDGLARRTHEIARRAGIQAGVYRDLANDTRNSRIARVLRVYGMLWAQVEYRATTARTPSEITELEQHLAEVEALDQAR